MITTTITAMVTHCIKVMETIGYFLHCSVKNETSDIKKMQPGLVRTHVSYKDNSERLQAVNYRDSRKCRAIKKNWKRIKNFINRGGM